jgi:hypothetical protein
MAMRLAGLNPLAPWGATAEPRHVRFGTRFVEEDQPGRIPAGLLPLPTPTRATDVGPVLLAGMERLFLYVSPIRTKT